MFVSRMHECMHIDGSKYSYAGKLYELSLPVSLRKHGIPCQIKESTAAHDLTDFIQKRKPLMYMMSWPCFCTQDTKI